MSTPFGCYLRELRRKNRLQQKQLAWKLSVDQTYISLIETGRKGSPKKEVVKKLIEVLNLDIKEQEKIWLLHEQSQLMRKVPHSLDEDIYVFVTEIFNRLESLSPRQREIIISVMSLEDKEYPTSQLTRDHKGVQGM